MDLAKKLASIGVVAALSLSAIGASAATGTEATWRVSDSASIGTIQTGWLYLQAGTMVWSIGEGDAAESVNPAGKFVPGTVLEGRATITPDLAGQSLVAELVANWAGQNLAGQQVSVTAFINGAELSTDGATPVAALDPSADDVPLTIVIRVEIGSGEVANDAVAPLTAATAPVIDLGELTFSLAQQGGGWRAQDAVFPLPSFTIDAPDTNTPGIDVTGDGNPDTLTPEIDVTGDGNPATVTPVVPVVPPSEPKPITPVVPGKPEIPPLVEVPKYCPKWKSWQQGGSYRAGDCVTWKVNGQERNFLAAWDSSHGQAPGIALNSEWMEFGDIQLTPDGREVREWTPTWIYARDANAPREVVSYQGKFYRVRDHSRTITPDAPNAPWDLVEFPATAEAEVVPAIAGVVTLPADLGQNEAPSFDAPIGEAPVSEVPAFEVSSDDEATCPIIVLPEIDITLPDDDEAATEAEDQESENPDAAPEDEQYALKNELDAEALNVIVTPAPEGE